VAGQSSGANDASARRFPILCFCGGCYTKFWLEADQETGWTGLGWAGLEESAFSGKVYES